MGRFEPVVIERSGGHYALRQGNETLFIIPAEIFDAFEADAVFPPQWTRINQPDPKPAPRHILWHMKSGELLMGGMGERPPLLAEVYGSHPFRSYLQAFWLPEYSRMIVRVYWNPSTPSDAFDTKAREKNWKTQQKFFQTAMRLMPPKNTLVTLNATDRYMRLKGFDGTGQDKNPSQIYSAHITPPSAIGEEKTEAALNAILTVTAGRVYPTITADRFFLIETLSKTDLEDAKTTLAGIGIDTGEEPHLPH